MTLPYITPKQQEILKLLLYRFRFVNRLQIQQYLQHKNKKTINIWLQDLRDKQYVNWIYNPTKFGENTKLAIYYFAINGIRYLKTQEGYSPKVIKKLYRDGKRAEPFINRCILLAEICLDLESKSTQDVSYSCQTENDYARENSPFHFLTSLDSHAPGLVFVKDVKQAAGNKTHKKYFLLDVIDDTLPRYKIRKRMKTYLDLYFTNGWENNLDALFPTILFVCTSKPTLIYAKRFTKKLLTDNQKPKNLHIGFATTDWIKESGVTGDSWEEIN